MALHLAMPCCKPESARSKAIARNARNATGLPFLVMPNAISPKDVNMESFADLVDRALADVREVLVTEHTRRLHMSTPHATSMASRSSRDMLPAQPSTWERSPQPPPSASAVASLVTECGTQTQVDWSLPVMPFAFSPPTDASKTLESVAPVARPADACGVEPKENKKEDKIVVTNRAFGSMRSEDLRVRNEEHALKIAQQVKDYGWQRMLKRSRARPLEMMDAVMGIVIFANAMAIAASCDTKDWRRGWFLVDSVFAAIFIFELLVKLCLLGPAGYFCGAEYAWAWFELGLVLLSLLEIGATLFTYDASTLNGSTLFRVIRLLRLVKLLRVCRIPMFADLVLMVSGIVGGFRTLMSALFLVVFPLFVFALVMRETLGEEPAMDFPTGLKSFDSLPIACFSTFRCLVVEDCEGEDGPIFVLVTDAYGWCYGMAYSLTFLVMKFGLFNVIIAIFVEQTVQAAKYNETYQRRARLNDQKMFQEKSLEMAELAYSLKKDVPQENVSCHLTLDEIQSLELSKEEFNELCTHSEFKELLTALDVAEEDHLDLFDTLDVDGGGTLDLGEIVTGIAKLRGDARKSDIVAVILLARHLNRTLHEFKIETTDKFDFQNRQLVFIQDVLQPMFNANARLTGGFRSTEVRASATSSAAVTSSSARHSKEMMERLSLAER